MSRDELFDAIRDEVGVVGLAWAKRLPDAPGLLEDIVIGLTAGCARWLAAACPDATPEEIGKRFGAAITDMVMQARDPSLRRIPTPAPGDDADD